MFWQTCYLAHANEGPSQPIKETFEGGENVRFSYPKRTNQSLALT